MSAFTMRLGTAACVLLMAATATAQIELTSNGDFETGDTSGWVEFLSPGQSFVTTSDAASGAFAGLLSNPNEGVTSVIKQANLGIGTVQPGDEVTISFDAKGVQGVSGVVFAEFFSEIDGGGVSSAGILGGGPLGLTDQYQTFNYTAIAGADVSGGVTLQFAAVTGAVVGASAELFVDNVSVSVAIPEPTTALLAGLALTAGLVRRRVNG